MTISELYRRCAEGDSAARENLFQELYVSFRIIARHRITGWDDAEDVVQAAVVKVSTKMDQLIEHSKFAAWAHRILRNEILDFQRKQRDIRNKYSGADVQSLEAFSDRPDSDLRRRLKDCLRKMNEVSGRHARILTLRYMGYNTREICDMLSLSPSNLYVLLHRARTMLKNCLESGEVSGE